MVRLVTATVILLAAGHAASQSSATISFLFPSAGDSQSATPTGSGAIINIDPTGTTLLLDCPHPVCYGFTSEFTLTVGPSSADATGGHSTDDITVSVHCNYGGRFCAVTARLPGPTTTTTTESILSLLYVTFVVTSGLDKLPSSSAGTTTAVKVSSQTSTITPASASSSATGTGTASPSKAAGAQMSPSNGGIVAAVLLWTLFG